MRKSIAVVAAAFTIACVSGAAAQNGGRPPPTLVADIVRIESAGETSRLVGRFVSLRSGPIAARVAGAVDEVLVDVGDRVEAGQPMIRLALSRLKAERERRKALLALASARIRSARATLKLASQSASRLAKLRNSAAFSEALLSDKQREAERAAAQVNEAQADYARAKAELDLAEVDLAYGEVRAPYGGVVAERHVDVGAYVALGAPVATLVGDKALEIEAEAPSDRMSGLKPGARAVVQYGGAEGAVPVRAVLPRETGVSRTRTVRFGPLPPNLAQTAIANAAVTVSAPSAAAEPALTVHKDAIIRTPDGPIAVIGAAADEPGLYRAERRPVKLGAAVGVRFVVMGGLAEGDIVVVRGNETLRPGQPFKAATR